MTLIDPPTLAGAHSTTLADDLAARTFAANCAALEITQPRIVMALADPVPEVTWVFARDGSLTCRDDTGRWWAGCSLPRRAGAAMLRRLEVPSVVGCLLAPAHAGEITAALERLQPTQAVVVIQPDLLSLRISLSCGDFATDITAHRLWFAWGESWESELSTLFDEQPGLPTPDLFIRTPALAEEHAARLIPAGEAVFARIGARRATQIAELQSTPAPVSIAPSGSSMTPRLLMLSRLRFRLWDDAGSTLAAAMRTGDGAPAPGQLDLDDPASTSVLALARAAQYADAVVTAGLSRAQLPRVVPSTCQVLTWLTTPAIPEVDPQYPTDGLLLADAAWLPAARAAGWSDDRIRVAAWPMDQVEDPLKANELKSASSGLGSPNPTCLVPRTDRKTIGLFADTWSLDTPKGELDLSSHHLLWEIIRAELCDDPFRLGQDVMAYLNRQRRAAGIAEEGFAAASFMERLLLPAYHQGLARVLLSAGIPVSLYGNGWRELPAFRDAARGSVSTRGAFREAVASSAAVIYPWPLRHAHAVDTLGRPVLTPGRNASRFLRDAHAAILGELSAFVPKTPFLSRSVIDELLICHRS